jgi:transcription termination/antitermination protein NusG
MMEAEQMDPEPLPGADSADDDLDMMELNDESLGEASADEDEQEETGPRTEWYVIHSYSGMENKVKKNIEHRAESMGMTEKILDIVVPTETEIEIRKGKRREVERRVFPGYILVNMIMDEDSWYVVRNSPGVTGFVGMGNKPTPLRTEEVDKIMKRIESDEPRIKVSFQVGEHVRIMSGPFAEFGGTVDEIYPDKGKAKVLVSFFNRETPVEVDFLQLERDT